MQAHFYSTFRFNVIFSPSLVSLKVHNFFCYFHLCIHWMKASQSTNRIEINWLFDTILKVVVFLSLCSYHKGLRAEKISKLFSIVLIKCVIHFEEVNVLFNWLHLLWNWWYLCWHLIVFYVCCKNFSYHNYHPLICVQKSILKDIIWLLLAL